MLRVLFSVLILSITLGTTSQASGQTINKFLTDRGGRLDSDFFDHDILRKAIATAGLTSALQNKEAKLTLFAPNDLAFVVLARDLGYEGFDERGVWNYLVEQLTVIGEGDPIAPLTNILLYHVAPDELNLLDVITSREIDTLLEVPFSVRGFTRLVDKEPDLTDPRLFFPLNYRYSNGIVHGINRVLLPLDL